MPAELNWVTDRIAKRFDTVASMYSEDIDGVVFTEKAFQEYFTKFVKIGEAAQAVTPRGFEFQYPRVNKAKVVDGKRVRFGQSGT